MLSEHRAVEAREVLGRTSVWSLARSSGSHNVDRGRVWPAHTDLACGLLRPMQGEVVPVV